MRQISSFCDEWKILIKRERADFTFIYITAQNFKCMIHTEAAIAHIILGNMALYGMHIVFITFCINKKKIIKLPDLQVLKFYAFWDVLTHSLRS